MILGIESTAHTFGVAVVDKGRYWQMLRIAIRPEGRDYS